MGSSIYSSLHTIKILPINKTRV
ncbi:hypothetical protein QN277_014386 [Acacia crassicarpa]|uniref:Uncharacterized protein n=1 Tax=Acacia crassicarpa TaxID=499986 RepID=A0AAE1MAK3_9FABA|nr:hypothetical protein QN277_014386 [Acacia crassicarpa]